MNADGLDWMSDWTAGARLWVERAGQAILGPGRLELLVTIDRCHSISAAARELGMSYRRAWLLVESINRAANQVLVRTQTGGRDGGGAQLTPHGRVAVTLYRELQIRLQRVTAAPLYPSTTSTDSPCVHMAVAASLENVLRHLLADYAVHQPTVTVRTICGASDELANHVLNGIHVDLFLSAEIRQLDRLERAGLITSGSRVLLTANRLTVIAAASRLSNPRGPHDLLASQVKRIALADPSCPLGNYTRCYLEPLGLWEDIQKRALFLDNPRVVLAAVEAKQADVGLVYRSDALAATDCRSLFSTRAGQPFISYSAALTHLGEQSPAARGLLHFLTSAAADRHFRRAGFLLLSPDQRAQRR